jgi:very-short-patch-repair endonuclease
VEVVEVLQALGGTARWKQLRGHVSWRAIKRATADGRVRRNRGAYASVETDTGRLLAHELRGVRSHLTAAAHHGLALPPHDTSRLDITVPRHAKRKNVPDDVRLHYRDYRPGAVEDDVTTPLETVIDCLRDEPLGTALSVGDSALAQGHVTIEQLEARTRALRGPGSAVARHRVRQLDGRAANAFESCCRALLIEAGIAGFEPQVVIRHRRRWVGRVDLAHRALGIVIECDGFETHGGRDAFIKDLVRFTLLVSAGWRPLRFTWEQVMFRPEWVLDRVHDTVADVEAVRGAVTTAQRRPSTSNKAA